MLFFALISLVAVASAAPQKRFIEGLLDTAELTHLLQSVIDIVGSNDSEHAIEAACHSVLSGETGLAHMFCTPLALSFQALVHQYDLTPDTPAAAKREMARRGLFDGLLDTAEMTHLLQGMIDMVGSDKSEAALEAACHSMLTGEAGLAHQFCKPLALSFQTLVHTFDITPDTNAVPAKRAFVGLTSLFDNQAVKDTVQTIVDLLGADATEQMVEAECVNIMTNALLDSFCPAIGNSFQALVHHFGISQQ